jgi:hypothetical protein
MSRAFAIGIAVLLLISAVAAFSLKGSMLGRFLLIAVMPGPDHSFTASHAQRALDYSLKSSWLAHPKSEDNTDWLPGGGRVFPDDNNPAYVFFVHPTAYLGSEHWVGTLDKNTATEENRQWIMANQASAYNGCCDVYAPYYREVSIATYFETDLGITTPAIDFAYRDVARAFESFLQQIPANSPFILASHSQGTLHGQRLLQQVIDDSPLHQRLVAAYLVGGTIHEHLFSSHYKAVGICETPTDSQCAIAFDTWRADVQPNNSVPNWVGDRYMRNNDRWLCVNPLSWEHNEEAVSARENPGSMPVQNEYNLYSLGGDVPVGLSWRPPGTPVRGVASAQCVGGVLRTNDIEPGLFDGQSWGGNYHSLDYALYYQSIRENAQVRVDARWRQKGTEKLTDRN